MKSNITLSGNFKRFDSLKLLLCQRHTIAILHGNIPAKLRDVLRKK